MADRRERIILILDDQMSRGLAQSAVESKNLERQLSATGREVEVFGRQADGSGRQIDRLSGRLKILVEAGLALGPAFIPAGGAAVAAIAGLVTQMGFAVAASGAVIGAFQGVGTAVEAVNKFQLEPTAANLEKVRQAMADLSPAGREFASFVESELQPALRELRDIGQENLFPGVTAGLDELLTRAPEFERIMATLTDTAGDVFADFGEGLASSQADEFFAFVEREARPALTSLAEVVGNVTVGLADMWMAFDPLSDEIASDLVAVTEDFQAWAATLADSPDFRAFLQYIIDTGPQVADTFGALVSALASIVEAAAPLGGPVLAALEAVARVVGAIAESDVGAPILALVVAFSAVRRSLALIETAGRGITGIGAAFTGISRGATSAQTSVRALRTDLALLASPRTSAQIRAQDQAVGRLGTRLAGLRSGAAVLGGVAIASTGLADSLGVTNAVSLALAGTIAGPWGVAVGAGVGLLLDFADASRESDEAAAAFAETLDEASGALTDASFGRIVADITRNDDLVEWAEENGIALSELALVVSQGPGPIRDLVNEYETVPAQANFIANELGAMNGVIEDGKAAWDAAADASRAARLAALGASTGFQGVALGVLSTAESLSGYIDAADEAERETRRLETALESLFGDLDVSNSLIQYEESLDQLVQSMKDADTFNPDFEEGRTNLRNLNDATQDTIGRFKLLSDQGKATDAQRFLTGAIRDLENIAENAGPKGKAAIGEALEGLQQLSRVSLKELGDSVIAEFNNLKAKGKEVAAQKLLTSSIADLRAMREDAGPKARAELDRIIGRLRDTNRAEANPKIGIRDNASGPMALIDRQRERLDGKSATITVSVNRLFSNIGDAVGDLFGGFAGAQGGILDRRNGHLAHIAPAGTWRVFAEDETGGEAYIPLRNDWRRPRAEAIWEETGRRLGIQFQRFADGGFGDSSYVSRGTPASPRVNFTASGPAIDYDRLADAVIRARPLYGTVNNYGADLETIKRQAEQDARVNALAGRPNRR